MDENSHNATCWPDAAVNNSNNRRKVKVIRKSQDAVKTELRLKKSAEKVSLKGLPLAGAETIPDIRLVLEQVTATDKLAEYLTYKLASVNLIFEWHWI